MDKKNLYIKAKLQEDRTISNKADQVFSNFKGREKIMNNEKKVIKISFRKFMTIAASFVLVLFLSIGLYTNKSNKNDLPEVIATNPKEPTKQAFKYALKGNSLEDFDLRFLQLENERKNKIYSPLSIKYTLGMLNEGTEGTSKEQISNLIGEYKSNKYFNSKNMSFANALLVRDTYKGRVKDSFVNKLESKYNANVVYDSFNSAKKINSWINDKTLNLIADILNDDKLEELDFILINALAIDMDWEEKFLSNYRFNLVDYLHEKYSWSAPYNLLSNNFEGVNNEISGMGIIASVNNYDIVKTLGEENIRKTVGDEFRKYLEESEDEWRSIILFRRERY